MAKKKKGYKGRSWYRTLGISLSGTSNRSNRRRASKYRRSRSYWISHDDVEFSKITLRDVEMLWLQTNAPSAVIEFREVHKPEQYPRYRAGLWDGKAFFVRFADRHEASRFKMSMWNFQI